MHSYPAPQWANCSIGTWYRQERPDGLGSALADVTRPDARGTVTANTYVQLETKTWAAIQKWHKLCLTARWFVWTTNRLYHRDSKETWFCSPATCKEENSEAFAGQHAADASSFYVFDEASAVPDKIFEVAEGGLSDGR